MTWWDTFLVRFFLVSSITYGDQVIQTPSNPRSAEVIGSTDFCKNAALAYGDRAISFQHHPEFDLGFAKKLFQVRKKTLSPEVIEETKKNLTKKVSHQVTQKIVEFLQKNQTKHHFLTDSIKYFE